MTRRLLTEHHLECLNLKGGCTGSSESALIKMQLLEIVSRLLYKIDLDMRIPDFVACEKHSSFVIRSLQSVILFRLSFIKNSVFKLVTVAKHDLLSLACSDTTKSGFLAKGPK